VIRTCFFGKDYREFPLVSQGKGNDSICGFSLGCSSEVLMEYALEYNRTLRSWNLLELDVIWA
jgi:hypothetical protein